MRRMLAVVTVMFFVVSLSLAQKSSDKTKADTLRFDKAEYLQGTSGGQVKAGTTLKGTLVFDSEKKNVDFLQESGSPAMSIKYDTIKNITYEKASKPRYAAAVLVSPLFLLSHGKKHYLTFQYNDGTGEGKYAIIHLDKKNAREAVACAEAQTGKKVEQIEEK
jgi:preprotein translocase subunit SecG